MRADFAANPVHPLAAVWVQQLCVRFGDFKAVKDVSFSVSKGEIFGFLGANGAGKTTTIRVLCGLLPPTSGDIQIAGVSYRDGEQAIKRQVGYMSQKFTLYDDLTVAENLSFTASLRKIERQTFLARRTELLDFIGFERPLDTSVRDLPGGLKQQISLAAALLHDPAIIFLDEPTAGVTPAARARFWSLIGNLKKAGKTIFVTTHYMDEAENCDRIALMRAGELIALDSAAGLKATAFPEPIWELTPMASPVTRVDIEALRRAEAVRSLQPYGIRFHLILKPGQQLEQLAPLLHGRFQVARTLPSLEDVFIELVEGGRHP